MPNLNPNTMWYAHYRCTSGGSDKEYLIEIVGNEENANIMCSHGRWQRLGMSYVKVAQVNFNTALQMCQTMHRERMKKQYVLLDSGYTNNRGQVAPPAQNIRPAPIQTIPGARIMEHANIRNVLQAAYERPILQPTTTNFTQNPAPARRSPNVENQQIPKAEKSFSDQYKDLAKEYLLNFETNEVEKDNIKNKEIICQEYVAGTFGVVVRMNHIYAFCADSVVELNTEKYGSIHTSLQNGAFIASMDGEGKITVYDFIPHNNRSETLAQRLINLDPMIKNSEMLKKAKTYWTTDQKERIAGKVFLRNKSEEVSRHIKWNLIN